MNNLRQFVSLERIESLKAGLLGGFSGTIAFLVTTAIERLTISQLNVLPTEPEALLSLLLAVTIAGASGFLFGVTYRYVIRRDRNPHLNSGAVLAFGLVRGLAQVSATLSGGFEGAASLLALVVMVLESIVLFAVAGRMLDWAMARDWIKPFEGDL